MAIEPARRWEPEWAVAPGEILLEVLRDRHLTQADLARRMGRPIKTINEIARGKAAITPDTAIQLERALGIAAGVWNNLESNYRGALAREQARAELEGEAGWLERFPLPELVKYGLIRKGLAPAEKVAGLLAFFEVSSPSAWDATWRRTATAFRASESFPSRPEAVAAWLRWGEILAERVECAPFDGARFRNVLQEVRELTRHEPFEVVFEDVSALCAKCGVAVVTTPEMAGAPLSGAARWVAADKALLQLSLRYRRDDQFWFTFFHEAGHLLAPRRRRDFVDWFDQGDYKDHDEEMANRFARDELIPPGEYAGFLDAGDVSSEAVRSFAAHLKISPGVVVGRLQHDRAIGPAQLNSLKKPIRWIQPRGVQRKRGGP